MFRLVQHKLQRQLVLKLGQRGIQTSDKITKMVTDISQLTLLETSQLVAELKLQLNIKDIVPTVAATTTAPLAPEQPQEQAPEKTSFKITLSSIDSAQKAKMIKEVKQLLVGANLVEAKKFVESVPKVLKENVDKEEALKVKKLLESIGGVVLME
jgi:ribosomal protein L7/L12